MHHPIPRPTSLKCPPPTGLELLWAFSFYPLSQVCEQLRESASKLKEKAGEVNEAVRAAINKHLTNAQQILDAAREFLVEKATNFKCEDALSEAVSPILFTFIHLILLLVFFFEGVLIA